MLFNLHHLSNVSYSIDHKNCSGEKGKDCQAVGSQVWMGTSQANSAAEADMSHNHTLSICIAYKLPNCLMHITFKKVIFK